MQPMNYTLNAADTGAAFDQGFNRQAGLMATAADYQKSQLMLQAQQQKMEMEAQKRADFQAVATNPTVKGYQRLITMYPELHEGVSKAASMLGDQDKRTIKQLGGSLAMAITKGKPESGVALIDQYIESAKNSGDESNRQRFEMLRDSVIANPDGALFGLHGMMQSVMDGKEYVDWSKGIEEAEKARQTRGSDVRKAEADADKAEADAGKAAFEAKSAPQKFATDIENTRSQIADRGARLGLDRDKFNLEFDSKVEELRGKRLVTLSAGMEKQQADAVGQSLASNDMATKAETLAAAIEKESQWGGAASWLANKGKEFAGFDGGMSALRREYIALRNKGVIEGLPPGVATDKDIELVKAGFPSENASQQEMANWLRSFAKVQKASAIRKEAEAEWISQNGNLSNTRKDVDIGGRKVPAGTSFNDFIKRTTGTPTTSADPVNALFERYGK